MHLFNQITVVQTMFCMTLINKVEGIVISNCKKNKNQLLWPYTVH